MIESRTPYVELSTFPMQMNITQASGRANSVLDYSSVNVVNGNKKFSILQYFPFSFMYSMHSIEIAL